MEYNSLSNFRIGYLDLIIYERLMGARDSEEFLLFNLGSLLVNIRYPQESFAF